MYLFSRQVRIGTGRTREAMAWAIDQTEKVRTITGLPLGLYTQVWSPDVGLIGFSTFVPDLATLESAADKLNVDDDFVTGVDKGAALTTGGADDTLAQVVHGTPDPNRRVEYVTAVRAVCANGSIAKGMEVGAEIAERAAKITGTPTLFLADATGSYGGVGWLSGHADVQAMQAAEEALATDAGWLKYIDKAVPGVYADDPSMTTQRIFRRLA